MGSRLSVLLMMLIASAGSPRDDGGWRHDRDRSLFREVGHRAEFSSVGLLRRNGSSESGGSGVLIRPSWVLTAAHVVDGWSPAEDYSFVWDDEIVPVAEVILHPGHAIRPTDDRVDLALVRLARSVRGVSPAEILESGQELGARVAMIGHGFAQPGNTLGANQTPPGEKYGGFNIVDSVTATQLLADFDSPVAPELNALGDAQPDSLEYIPLGGDSGGGVFVRVGDEWQLAGINGWVRFSLDHVDRHGWYGLVIHLNRVAPQLAWIEATVER